MEIIVAVLIVLVWIAYYGGTIVTALVNRAVKTFEELFE